MTPGAAAWALQRFGAHIIADKEHLAPAAAGLRTLIVPSNKASCLADLAWSLSQHPRARFAVCINAGLDVHGGNPAVADAAAMLSGEERLVELLLAGSQPAQHRCTLVAML